eukprot:3775809-Prymnesium_polylepis.1
MAPAAGGGRRPGGRRPGGRRPGGRCPGGRRPGGRCPGGRRPVWWRKAGHGHTVAGYCRLPMGFTCPLRVFGVFRVAAHRALKEPRYSPDR